MNDKAFAVLAAFTMAYSDTFSIL